MEIVPAGEAFELPDGWIVEVRPRINSPHTPDKYYYEPHTGRKFRSIPSIKRYLNGEDEPTPRRKARKTHHEKEFEVAERKENVGRASVNRGASSKLPDGWIVEKVPRRRGSTIDNYYIEPSTGRKFRSIPEVQRYLSADDDEFPAKYKPLQMINSTAPKKPEKSISDLLYDPPAKITWTLTSTSSDSNKSRTEKWIAFLESFMIPDYVRHLWDHTFFFGMTAGKVNYVARDGHIEAPR